MEAVKSNQIDNVIQLQVLDGKLGKKPKVKYNKDGSIDKRHCNKKSGVSSEVYPFTTKEEIKSMIDTFDKHIDNAVSCGRKQIAKRNKMLFLVGINLSLRISDLVSIKWKFFFNDDMTFKDFYKIKPKKTEKLGKYVKIYFNEVVKKSVSEYIEEYPFDDMEEFVFKSMKGDGAISERAVWKIMIDSANESGITYKNIGTHSLRKTFGYHVWHDAEDKELALVKLMIIFNHSSIATTKQYIGVMDKEIEAVFNDLNLGLDLI
jgi:integrase